MNQFDDGTVDRDGFDAHVKQNRLELSADGWHVSTDRQAWIEYFPPVAFDREAGRKLHISSSVRCAANVLEACVPLFSVRTPWVSSMPPIWIGCCICQTGQGGRTQVGKFMTVYPADDSVAALLAEELHIATSDFYGPRIPHEQPYKSASLVYSRFGAFTQRWLQLPSGRIVPVR